MHVALIQWISGTKNLNITSTKYTNIKNSSFIILKKQSIEMKSEVDRYKDNTITVQQVRQGKFPAISGLHAEAAVATLLGNLPPSYNAGTRKEGENVAKWDTGKERFVAEVK